MYNQSSQVTYKLLKNPARAKYVRLFAVAFIVLPRELLNHVTPELF